MIYGIGVDATEVDRVRGIVERHGERFLQKVFAPAETAYAGARARKYEHLAARFAAKEAALKALGIGVAEGMAFNQIEVTNDESGKPGIRLHGAALQRAQERGISRIHLSISHTETLAIAQVIMEVGSS